MTTVKGKAFHLNIAANDLAGATIALIPGDPGRVEKIAAYLEAPHVIGQSREFKSAVGTSGGRRIAVVSTGIGGPSTSICVEELAQLGIKTFVRIGTTGAIQESIQLGDAIVTQAAVRMDGASRHFAPLAYPAVADFFVTKALVEAAQHLKAKFHVGITASSDTFYPGQERYDTLSGRVIRELQGSMKEWQALHVLNYEMESATLFTMGAALGLRTGMVAAVIAHRCFSEAIQEKIAHQAEDQAIRIAIDACHRLG